MKYNFPGRLFRYRSFDNPYAREEIRRAVLRSEVFMSVASALNDPLEFKPIYEGTSLRVYRQALKDLEVPRKFFSREMVEEQSGRRVSRKEFKRLPGNRVSEHEQMKLQLKAHEGLLWETPDRTRLACFSANGTSIPMWAHYADNHAGFCLEYKIDLNLPTQVLERTPIQVVYQTERPRITIDDLIKFSGRSPLVDDAEKMRILEQVFLIKSSDWAYEKEYRVFDTVELAADYEVFPRLKPTALILGYRMSEEIVAELVQSFSKHIPIFQSKLSEQNFEMERELIS